MRLTNASDTLRWQMPTESVRETSRNLVVHVLAPVARHSSLRPGHALVDRVMLRRRELRPLVGLLGFVAVKPVLTRLEAADERVARSRSVRGRVLHGRRVAAADVPALRARSEEHTSELQSRLPIVFR